MKTQHIECTVAAVLSFRQSCRCLKASCYERFLTLRSQQIISWMTLIFLHLTSTRMKCDVAFWLFCCSGTKERSGAGLHPLLPRAMTLRQLWPKLVLRCTQPWSQRCSRARTIRALADATGVLCLDACCSKLTSTSITRLFGIWIGHHHHH